MTQRNLVDVSWLSGHLGDPSVVVVDCRFDLAKPDAGRRAYEDGHIPGAVYLDLDRDLSAPKQVHGGRHPLPDREAFCRLLGTLGVDADVTVVAYDMPQTGVTGAARLWWMLRFLGHDRVYVLDGGWRAWVAAGQPVARDAPPPPSGTRPRDARPSRAPRRFIARPRPEMAAGVEEVRRISARGGAVIVDSRAPERYRGEVEPIDPIAGHVPGAINLPWGDALDKEGRFKSKAVLAERFAGLAGEHVVAYCGSGVTACANLLAMDEAGVEGARLYPGSWSDWCSYPENPAARGAAEKERKR